MTGRSPRICCRPAWSRHGGCGSGSTPIRSLMCAGSCSKGSCGAGVSSYLNPVVPVGQPVTITFTLRLIVDLANAADFNNLKDAPLPAEGSFAVAIAEPVPFAEYPLPRRPSRLEPLDEGVVCFSPLGRGPR